MLNYNLLSKHKLLDEDKPKTIRYHLEELFLDCIYVIAYFIIQSYYHKLFLFNIIVLLSSLLIIYYTV